MKLFNIFKRFEAVLIFIILFSAQIVRADEYSYDDNGRITQVEHEDGSSTVYSYDDNGNLLSVETVSPANKENSNNKNTNENQANIPSDNKEQQLSDNKESKPSDNKEQKLPDNQQQQVVNTVPDNPENNSKIFDGERVNKNDNKKPENNKNENIDPSNIDSQERDKLDVKQTDKNSSTGDSTHILLLVILMGISLSAIVVLRKRIRG